MNIDSQQPEQKSRLKTGGKQLLFKGFKKFKTWKYFQKILFLSLLEEMTNGRGLGRECMNDVDFVSNHLCIEKLYKVATYGKW